MSRLNAILENTSDLVSAALPDARLTYLNRAGRRMAGWDQEESLDGKVIADLHPDWVMRKIESEGLPSAAALGSWEGETAIRHRDGREIPVSQVILSHRSADGDLQYFSTIMRNIAERKHAQKKLAHSHDLMRYIIEHNRSAVAVHDRGMRYIYVSQRYLDEYNVKELAYKVHHALLDQGC